MGYKQTDIKKALKYKERYRLYRERPMLWLQERFGEDPRYYKWSEFPEYDNHVWDGDKDPLYQAWMDIARGKRRISIEAATGTGKTFFLSRLVFWFLDCFEDSLVVTTGPGESQLKHNLWSEISKAMDKFKKLRPHSRTKNLDLKPEGNNPSSKVTTQDSHQAIGRVAGIGADEQSATKMQGFHRKDMLIIIEEMAGVHPAAVTALKNTCTGVNNIILGVGNPDSELDQLHQFATLPDATAYRISAFDHPNIVLKTDFIMGAVTVPSIESRRAEYGEDSPLWLSRVRGITPNESETTLIRRAWIDNCTMGHPTFYAKNKPGPAGVGVDVANSENGDKAALAWGKGNRLTAIQEFQCPNATHLAWNMWYSDEEIELMNKDREQFNTILDYHTIKMSEYGVTGDYMGVDTVGVGVSTFNAFMELGIRPQSLMGGARQLDSIIPMDSEEKPLYSFDNKRSQMYWELREDMRKGDLVIDIADPALLKQVRTELSTARFNLKAGAISVEHKEQIKKRLGGKSPNKADAIAYWNWARKGYEMDNIGFAAIYGGA